MSSESRSDLLDVAARPQDETGLATVDTRRRSGVRLSRRALLVLIPAAAAPAYLWRRSRAHSNDEYSDRY